MVIRITTRGITLRYLSVFNFKPLNFSARPFMAGFFFTLLVTKFQLWRIYLPNLKYTVVSTTFLSNPKLKTIKPGWPGNKVINGQFANGEELFNPSFLKVLKWKLSRNPQKIQKEQDHYVPPVTPHHNLFTSADDAVVWLGHATFLIRLNGFNFLTDPVLFDLPLIKRRTYLPCPPEAFKNIDFLLLSHGHRDHLDEKSIRQLYRQNPGLQAMVPLKMGELLHQMVPGLVYQEAGWFQEFTITQETGVKITYLPASHWHRRGLMDMNKVLWGSFLLRTPTKKIFFAGDTSYKEHFREIKELFGPPDISILPIGAYKPDYIMQKSHLDPKEAVQAFSDLGSKKLIPMHYGTFDLSDEPPGEPVRLMQEFAAAGQINGQLLLPAVGEVLEL